MFCLSAFMMNPLFLIAGLPVSLATLIATARTFIEAEVAQYARLIKNAGIQPN